MNISILDYKYLHIFTYLFNYDETYKRLLLVTEINKEKTAVVVQIYRFVLQEQLFKINNNS